MSPQLPRFATPGGTCVIPCNHTYCKLVLMMAAAPCARCGQKVGLGREFGEGVDGRLFHVECPPKKS